MGRPSRAEESQVLAEILFHVPEVVASVESMELGADAPRPEAFVQGAQALEKRIAAGAGVKIHSEPREILRGIRRLESGVEPGFKPIAGKIAEGKRRAETALLVHALLDFLYRIVSYRV